MNNVPEKLKNEWKEKEVLGIKRMCMRADEGNCQGRLTKEHAITFAGRQVQEEWAILDICEFHHDVGAFQGTGDLNKEKHVCIALNRATEDRLVALSKAEDKIRIRNWLNNKYGVCRTML